MRGVRRVVLSAVAVSAMFLAPAAAQAASIFGTVSDEVTHVEIGGVEVCPTPQPYSFEVDCVETDPSGHYSFSNLPAAQYMLSFSGWLNNLPYVSEFYDNKQNNLGADLVTLSSPGEARQLDVGLAPGGSIGGTLTDESNGQPVVGMAACARADSGNYERCAKSGAGGSYQINGLPSGEYSVYYEGWNQVNYLREFYEDVETWAQATPVEVAAPGTTSGIDAEVAQGAQIFGHVSQAGTGLPLPEAFVCAELQSPGEYQECDLTDADGKYGLVGLPAGTYLVAFEREYLPFGPTAGQWWQGAASPDQATPLAIVPPETRTGIDGVVDRAIWATPEKEAAPPAVVLPPPVGVTPKAQLSKCRRGFHRKLVRGKKRCVRKHRRHHSGHRPHR